MAILHGFTKPCNQFLFQSGKLLFPTFLHVNMFQDQGRKRYKTGIQYFTSFIYSYKELCGLSFGHIITSSMCCDFKHK